MTEPDAPMHIAVWHRTTDPATGRFRKVQKTLCGEPLGTSYLLRFTVKTMKPADRKAQLCAKCNARCS
jgi:hypothetical protein